MKFDVDVRAADTAVLPPRLKSVFDYWTSLKTEERRFPQWSAFRLTDLPSKVIPFIIVLDVKDDPLDFVYRFWGTANTTYIGYDCTGKSVRDNPLFSTKVFNECKQVVEQRRGLVFFSKVMRDDGLYREYARIRLPLSDDGETVSHIVSAVHIEEKLSDIFGDGPR